MSQDADWYQVRSVFVENLVVTIGEGTVSAYGYQNSASSTIEIAGLPGTMLEGLTLSGNSADLNIDARFQQLLDGSAILIRKRKA